MSSSSNITSSFRTHARDILARRGTSLWAAFGFAGDLANFMSGAHFDNPARMTSMALGMGIAVMLWAWGDLGNDKVEGSLFTRGYSYARNRTRQLTNCGLDPQQIQKMCFSVNIGTGVLLAVAGLDLTHPKKSSLHGTDFRPIEVVYGGLVALAFTALSLEGRMPDRETAEERFGKKIGSVLHNDNMRKIASLCFAPCGLGQFGAGVVNQDPFVFAAGVLQNIGGLCLWSSTRLKKQREAASRAGALPDRPISHHVPPRPPAP